MQWLAERTYPSTKSTLLNYLTRICTELHNTSGSKPLVKDCNTMEVEQPQQFLLGLVGHSRKIQRPTEKARDIALKGM